MCDCDRIFSGFQWKDLASLSPKELPSGTKSKTIGVYAIRISRRGEPKESILSDAETRLKQTDWESFKSYVSGRLNRLKRIDNCPIVYIGAAPTSIRERYMDLCGRRHTALFPFLGLVFSGWKLDFGWKEDPKPKETEAYLKNQYRSIHGSLPALMAK